MNDIPFAWTSARSRSRPVLTFVLTLTFALAAPGGFGTGLQAQVPVDTGASASAGARIFGTHGCASCHRIRGYGKGDAPDLGRSETPSTFYSLGASLWNHSVGEGAVRLAGVDGIERLDSRETKDLIAFLFALRYFSGPGDIEGGRALFDEKGCIRCHSVGGVGGAVGPSLDYFALQGSPIQLAATMWSHGAAMQDQYAELDVQRPELSGSELGNLAAYLESGQTGISDRRLYVTPGRPSLGRELFQTRQCIRCHGEPGQGGDVGPDLGARTSGKTEMEVAAAMWNHQPRMLSVAHERGIRLPTLSPEDMSHIIGYLYSIRYLADSGTAGRGRQVFRSAGCRGCHSLSSRGERPQAVLGNPELDSPAAVIGALWNHALLAIDSGESLEWSALSGTDVAGLVALLRGNGS